MWRWIIIHDLDNILNKIEAEHPYKVPGDSSSYNQYNEGWCDCLDRVRLELKDVNDGWIPVEERLPEDERANYEVTFINECGYEEHGFAQWYDGEFHIPAVVIAWREHLEPYRPEPLETRKELERRENERD